MNEVACQKIRESFVLFVIEARGIVENPDIRLKFDEHMERIEPFLDECATRFFHIEPVENSDFFGMCVCRRKSTHEVWVPHAVTVGAFCKDCAEIVFGKRKDEVIWLRIDDEGMLQEVEDNPFILSGDELARAEQFRKEGRS